MDWQIHTVVLTLFMDFHSNHIVGMGCQYFHPRLTERDLREHT